MKKMYLSPAVFEYGSISDNTGIFGGPSAGDILVDQNGNTELELENSIDACAERNGKCICEDNGTC